MRESVPYRLIRVGDVIDDLGQLAVVTHTQAAGPSGPGRIQSVCADGQWREMVYPLGAAGCLVSRVGEGCAPKPRGLRDFLAQHRLLPFSG